MDHYVICLTPLYFSFLFFCVHKGHFRGRFFPHHLLVSRTTTFTIHVISHQLLNYHQWSFQKKNRKIKWKKNALKSCIGGAYVQIYPATDLDYTIGHSFLRMLQFTLQHKLTCPLQALTRGYFIVPVLLYNQLFWTFSSWVFSHQTLALQSTTPHKNDSFVLFHLRGCELFDCTLQLRSYNVII